MSKQSQTFIPTLREVPSDAEIISHQLLLRAGYARQLAAGVYSYLPLGVRVIQKIMAIVREEMNRIGSVELLMPTLQPAELWQKSGRWDVYGPELMRLHDRHDRPFALGPTHEEVITTLVGSEVNSYKRLPLSLYQIQTKFRDEKRPRFGLIRCREFIMKDAYSFHTSKEDLNRHFQEMYEAYTRIFTRAGLNFRAVEADAGSIGGTGTYEFMALCDIGEDTIAYATEGNYAANIEKAEVVYEGNPPAGETPAMEKVHTPEVKTIQQLSQFFSVNPDRIVKTLVYRVDDKLVAVLVRGDHELNETKLKNYYDAVHVEMASDEEIRQLAGCSAGFVGPVGLDANKVDILADNFVQNVPDAIVGANEPDHHYTHARYGRDYQVTAFLDLRNIMEGDKSPRGTGTIAFARGIEVGHVFKLGTKYSEPLGATYLDENGRTQVMEMGCYGIGVSRMVAAILEQNHDENGIIWPVAVAPFQVHVIPVNVKVEEQQQAAEQIYGQLQQAGLEVLLDDRPERAGVKFKDADLIGIPLRVTVSDKAVEGIVEVKARRTGHTEEVRIDELVSYIQKLLPTLDPIR